MRGALAFLAVAVLAAGKAPPKRAAIKQPPAQCKVTYREAVIPMGVDSVTSGAVNNSNAPYTSAVELPMIHTANHSIRSNVSGLTLGASPRALLELTDAPWCCARYVHVGKTGGTSFEEFARETGIPDAITFHHSAAYFVGARRPSKCIFGTTLRQPGTLFVSMYFFCRGRTCPRPFWSCGFLGCDTNSDLHHLYQNPHSRIDMDAFLSHPEKWRWGQNVMTRQLGAPTEDAFFGRKGSVKYLEGQVGQQYLERAKRILHELDFLLFIERADETYGRYFGVASLKVLPEIRQLHHPKATPQQLAIVESLNKLDMELYAYASKLYPQVNIPGSKLQ